MISVCMATYNGEKYLREQVDSILTQLNPEDELIISDDGSTDNTLDILASYHDNRIKIVQNQTNHGVNNNFNNALIHSQGDIIFLADQDDVWLPDKVNTCCEALQHCDCVVHDAIVVDQNLNVLQDSFFEERHSGKGFWKNLYKNTYLGCCMAFKKELLDYILPIPDTKAFFHDNWIGSIADLKKRIYFFPYKGILFRRHSNNTSSTAGKSRFSRFIQLKNRIKQLSDTIQRILHR